LKKYIIKNPSILPEILYAYDLSMYLNISSAWAHELLNSNKFSTLIFEGRKAVSKDILLKWIKEQNQRKQPVSDQSDYIGKKYNMLTVLSRVKHEPGQPVKFLCRCDCGNEIVVIKHVLLGGKYSCGCTLHPTSRSKMTDEDMIGKKFGLLTVLSKEGYSEYKLKSGKIQKYKTFKCKCDCGNEIIVIGTKLRLGRVSSCGCLSKTNESCRLDLTGQRFGKLVAIKDVGKKAGQRLWRCKCDCGNYFTTRASTLTRGHALSCGCLKKINMEVRIDITGKRSGKLVAIKDVGTNKKLQRLWECKCDCGNTIITKATNISTGKSKSCGCISKEIGRENLEIVRNDGTLKAARDTVYVDKTFLPVLNTKPTSTNTSGRKGVSQRKYDGQYVDRWQASIRFQGRSMYLGTYNSKAKAIKARETAEKMLWTPVLEKHLGYTDFNNIEELHLKIKEKIREEIELFNEENREN